MQAFTFTINFPNSSDWTCDQNLFETNFERRLSTWNQHQLRITVLLKRKVYCLLMWDQCEYDLKECFQALLWSILYWNDLFLVERIPLSRSWYSLNVMKIRSKDLHIFICLPLSILDSVVFCVFISSCRLLVIYFPSFFFTRSKGNETCFYFVICIESDDS